MDDLFQYLLITDQLDDFLGFKEKVKCPNCGDVVNTLDVKCPSCGFEFENKEVSKSLKEFIEKVNDKIIATPLDGRDAFEVSKDTLVSMNFFGFKKLSLIPLM